MLTFMSLEFKFLHLKSQCKMLIGVDYIWHHGYTIEMHGVNRDSICEGCKASFGIFGNVCFNRPFYSYGLSILAFEECEAEVDLALTQTSFLF